MVGGRLYEQEVVEDKLRRSKPGEAVMRVT